MILKMTTTESEQYQRITSGKEQVLERLRRKGFRVTKQRRQILDVIFEYDCTSCKEIYYRAIQKNSKIGIATVYRMVNTLTDIGVLKETSLKPQTQKGPGTGCDIILRNHKVVVLTEREWKEILGAVLRKKGIHSETEIERVVIRQ